MRKVFLVAMLVFICSLTEAEGAPFLCCDPVDGAQSYSVTVDGVTETGVAIKIGWIVEGNKLKLTDPGNVVKAPTHILKDLSGLATGQHTAIVKACDLWGCSADSSALPFTRFTLGAPTSISIVGP